MVKTVVGIFDSVEQAQHAVERLLNSGFDRGMIDLSAHETTEGVDSAKIQVFFNSLFESPDEASMYCDVATKSAAIVSVQAAHPGEPERIAQILDECGSVDVISRAKELGLEPLPGPTEFEKDDFSGSDEVAGHLANDDPTGETPIPIERDNTERTPAGSGLRSRIVDHPVEEESRLREERVKVVNSSDKMSDKNNIYLTFKK